MGLSIQPALACDSGDDYLPLDGWGSLEKVFLVALGPY